MRTITIGWGSIRREPSPLDRFTGRQTSIVGYGNNAPEIEADGLRRAAERFAPGAKLMVDPAFAINLVQGVDSAIIRDEAATRLPGVTEPRLYYASLRVLELTS